MGRVFPRSPEKERCHTWMMVNAAGKSCSDVLWVKIGKSVVSKVLRNYGVICECSEILFLVNAY